jgi:hypothetical protein
MSAMSLITACNCHRQGHGVHPKAYAPRLTISAKAHAHPVNAARVRLRLIVKRVNGMRNAYRITLQKTITWNESQ